MRSVQELIDKNIYREEMTTEEHIAFVNYWFDEYEKHGFCETFDTPFDLKDEDESYVGKRFQVTGRVELYEADLETLPMWHIEFEDGHWMDAYPEEITKLERVVREGGKKYEANNNARNEHNRKSVAFTE